MVTRKNKRSVTKKKKEEAVKKEKKETDLKVIEEPKEISNPINEKDIDDFLFGSETKLTDTQKMLFKKSAIMFKLNPFKREIYAVAYKGKMSLITGYEVYLKRADRTGKLAGWEVETFGTVKNLDLKAVITIYRKDFTKPFKHEVFYSEYVQTTFDNNGKKVPNYMWKSKPITMIKKVVMAQGFRLAFPDELGGMPYTSDEMPVPDEELSKKVDSTDQPKAEPVLVDVEKPLKDVTPPFKKTDEKEKDELKIGKMEMITNIKSGLNIMNMKEDEFKKKYNVSKQFLDMTEKELTWINDKINALVYKEVEEKAVKQ